MPISFRKPRSNFTSFLWVAFGILSFAFALEVFLAPAAGQRPDLEQALADFSARYADAAVNDIRITRDEVTTRSFAVEYRNKATGHSGTLEIHYADRGEGKWSMYPVPAETLP